MNILFYHKYAINPNTGGISRITHNLASLFISKGHGVFYLSELKQEKGQDIVEQHCLPCDNLMDKDNIQYLHELIRCKSISIVINQFAINKHSTDFLVISKQKIHFRLISCFHNSILTPAINYAYQKEYYLRKKNLLFIFNFLKKKKINVILQLMYIHKHRQHFRKAVIESDAVVSLCSGLKSELVQMVGLGYLSNMYVIPNCVNVPADSLNRMDKENEVLWVGTFDTEVKRPDIMLCIWQRICQDFPDWSLRMLGDGPAFYEMKVLSEKMGLKNIYFEGRVNPDSYYQRAKILALTSTHESFSLVTIEAKSFGVVPVIFNTFPAATLVVRDKIDGLLVNPFDVNDFVLKLISLMESEEKLCILSQNTKDGLTPFTYENIYKHWDALFKDINKQGIITR